MSCVPAPTAQDKAHMLGLQKTTPYAKKKTPPTQLEHKKVAHSADPLRGDTNPDETRGKLATPIAPDAPQNNPCAFCTHIGAVFVMGPFTDGLTCLASCRGLWPPEHKSNHERDVLRAPLTVTFTDSAASAPSCSHLLSQILVKASPTTSAKSHRARSRSSATSPDDKSGRATRCGSAHVPNE